MRFSGSVASKFFQAFLCFFFLVNLRTKKKVRTKSLDMRIKKSSLMEEKKIRHFNRTQVRSPIATHKVASCTFMRDAANN